MSDESPTLQDVWRLLGSMNRRFGERFDAIEREMVTLKIDLTARLSKLEANVASQVGALKESIEARDFRLDEQGRRLRAVEEKLP